MTGRVVQINVSPGGVPKRPVPRAPVVLDGAYARVLVPGEIAAGDPVARLTPAEVARHLAVGLGG